MNKGRVVSCVHEPWGQGTVFSHDDDKVEVVKEAPPKPSRISKQEMSLLDFGYNTTRRSSSVTTASETQGVKEFSRYGLPYFQSSLFATILEDTITEVRILSQCNTEMRISKTMADMKLHLALKYGVEQPATTDELDGIDHHKLGCIEYKLNKLDSDRNLLKGVLESVYIDLSVNFSYSSLAAEVDRVVARDNYYDFLVEDEAKNHIHRRELAKQLRQQRNHNKSITYDTDVIIDNLKTEVEDAALNAEIRSRYIDNWQKARTEQHTQTIYDKESRPTHCIEYYKERTDHEQRVHSEVELLINIAINETLEKVEKWMNKYDKDMEAIDLKIQIKKNDYQNQHDIRIGLENTIEKHDKLMKEWIHFKEEREKARQYREKMTKSAITVQAWWRGLLVRLQLGPYKVVKKKGGKDKKK